MERAGEIAMFPYMEPEARQRMMAQWHGAAVGRLIESELQEFERLAREDIEAHP